MPYLEIERSPKASSICRGCRKRIRPKELRLSVRFLYGKRRFYCRQCGAKRLAEVAKRFKKLLGVVDEKKIKEVWEALND